jgi:hypothetical protein
LYKYLDHDSLPSIGGVVREPESLGHVTQLNKESFEGSLRAKWKKIKRHALH